MKHNVLNPLFYIGLLFITIGTLFKIQHWQYGALSQSFGIILELLFFVLVIVEILTSKKAALSHKILFASIFIILPVVVYLCLPALLFIFAILLIGSIYLTRIRKRFLYTRIELIAKDFDAL